MWFANQGFIGHQLAALVAQNWLVFKACDMPARDALRNGWRITGIDNELQTAALEAADRRMGIKRVLRDFLTMGRVFGVRIAIPQVNYENRDEAYALPYNPDAVKPGMFQGWVLVDPYWTAPDATTTQPDRPHFYDPEYWTINGKEYHRSHLVIYRHGLLADILKPAYYYGGIPLPQLIMERVYGAERSANEAPLLALTKRTVVYKTDLDRALANYEKLQEKIRQQTELWSNTGVRVIDIAEDHVQHDTALADLDALIMTQYQLVAAVAEVPATKLLGTSAKGFNATGENDERNYHESLESIQENDLQPFLDRHYELLARSQGIEGVVVTAEWNPLAVPTASDAAATELSEAQADAALITAGVIGPDESRKRLNEKDGGMYSGQLDGDAPEAPTLDPLGPLL
jgi:phage-related protein (TIGR01555 family)